MCIRDRNWTGTIRTDETAALNLDCVELEPGKYQLSAEIINVNGQSDELPSNNRTAIHTAEIFETPELSYRLVDSAWCGTGGAIRLTTSGGAEPYQYIHEDLDQFQSEELISGLVNKKYDMVVIDAHECSDTISVEVPNNCPPCKSDLYIPNIFTPNRDGINDEFKAVVSYTRINEMRIFNKWGIEVFQSKSDDPVWNGTFRGKPVDAGTYIYLIKGICPDGNPFTVSGNINVLK